MSGRDARVAALRRGRERSRLLRASVAGLILLSTLAWIPIALGSVDLLSPRRQANLQRFLGELRPYPLQGEAWDWGLAMNWTGGILGERGLEAMLVTLGISVAAIALAALLGGLLALPAARNFATPEPYIQTGRRPAVWRQLFWWILANLTRLLLVFFRAIPEYVWAFLLLALMGPSAWPAVLALAIHNSGILGKLGAEVVENLDRAPLAALRGAGAGRLQLALVGIFPLSLSRFLLYFFYRWETCVREATVLGMLGIVSLGYWIADARARHHYDEMFFLVLLGVVLVLVGDLVSGLVRAWLRRA
jgi:phosphonate transport system permease protein